MKKTNFDRYLEEQMQDPAFAMRFKQAGEAWDVALQIAALREQAGLSQKDLARKLRTSQQQISRLESPEYEGHSLRMLRRLAKVLHARVRVVLEPEKQADALADYSSQLHSVDGRWVWNPAERTNGTFGSGAFCSDSWRAALRFLCERLSPTTQRELKCNEPMRQIWVFDARPPMGPRIATPVAAIEWAAALGHRRLYPIGDRARRSGSRGREEKCEPKTKKCYLYLEP